MRLFVALFAMFHGGVPMIACLLRVFLGLVMISSLVMGCRGVMILGRLVMTLRSVHMML